MHQKCRICGSDTLAIHHPRIGLFHYCTNCEFISKSEGDIISHADELKIYSTHQNSIDDPRYVDYFYKFLDEAVFPFVKGEIHGLDFGSGPSPVLSQLLIRDHNFKMDIYDYYYASDKVYLNKQYDLILSTEVVEHLSDPIAYFQLFVDLLKPGGVLAIMTLFHNNDEAYFLDWHYIRDLSHVSFYTLKTMETIARIVGLKIVHSNNVRYTTFVLDDNRKRVYSITKQ